MSYTKNNHRICLTSHGWCRIMYACICMHMHTYIYHICTYTITYIYTHLATYTHPRTLSHTHMHTYTHMYAHTHRRTHMYTHMYTHIIFTDQINCLKNLSLPLFKELFKNIKQWTCIYRNHMVRVPVRNTVNTKLLNSSKIWWLCKAGKLYQVLGQLIHKTLYVRYTRNDQLHVCMLYAQHKAYTVTPTSCKLMRIIQQNIIVLFWHLSFIDMAWQLATMDNIH